MKKLLELLKKLGVKDADIAEVEEAYKESIDEEVEGLKKKNQELISRMKAARDGEGGKVADLETKIEDLTAQLEKTKKDGDKALKKAQDELKAAQDLAGTKTQALTKLIRDDGLRKALGEVKVKAEFLEAAHALLRDRVQVDEDKAEAFAMVKDKDGKETRKALAEYAKDWAASDEGRTS